MDHGERRRPLAPQGSHLQRRALPRRRPPVELYNIAQDPSEKNNVAAQNPEKVAALQQRANELASAMAKPLILETEFKAMLQRIKLPPSLPAELDSLNRER
jgi:hypothetical protein